MLCLFRSATKRCILPTSTSGGSKSVLQLPQSHEAIYNYISNLRVRQSSGYILTACSVESIFYLTLAFREGVVRMCTESSTSTVEKAGRLLQTFSRKIMSAARALKASQCVLELGSRSYHLDSPIADFPGTDSTLDMMAGQSAT
jgi:hypothetical protein